MLDYCIIGSGISGSTIANYLKKNYSIKVFDKARGVGGRSSFKRYKGNIGFDHGLQYLSPRSKEFKSFTNKLIKKKVLKYWRPWLKPILPLYRLKELLPPTPLALSKTLTE